MHPLGQLNLHPLVERPMPEGGDSSLAAGSSWRCARVSASALAGNHSPCTLRWTQSSRFFTFCWHTCLAVPMQIFSSWHSTRGPSLRISIPASRHRPRPPTHPAVPHPACPTRPPPVLRTCQPCQKPIRVLRSALHMPGTCEHALSRPLDAAQHIAAERTVARR